MPFCTDHKQSAGLSGLIGQLDICTTACHIRGDCHGTGLSCMRNDFCFSGMMLRIQHLMRNPHIGQQFGQQLRFMNRRSTNQNRLPTAISLMHSCNHSRPLCRLCQIHSVLFIHTLDWLVRRNPNDRQSVDRFEFLRRCNGSTCHTSLLLILIEEILERDRRHCLCLALNINMFLGLQSLMQAIRKTPAFHDTTCKTVHQHHSAVFDHVIPVTLIQRMCLQSHLHMMTEHQMLRIGIILQVQDLLDLPDTPVRQVHAAVLFIDHIIAGLLSSIAGQRIQLADLTRTGAALQLLHQVITLPVKLQSRAFHTRNNQRRPGLVDQYRIDFVHDRIKKTPLHAALLIHYHVITQIVESQFIVRHIRDIAGICLLTAQRVHPLQNHAHRYTEKPMNPSDIHRITVGQIIINSHNMHAAARQTHQIRRKSCHKGLTLASLHLSNMPLVKGNTAQNLNVIRIQSDRTISCFPDRCKRLRQQLIQGPMSLIFQPQLLCLPGQLFITQNLHHRSKPINLPQQTHHAVRYRNRLLHTCRVFVHQNIPPISLSYESETCLRFHYSKGDPESPELLLIFQEKCRAVITARHIVLTNGVCLCTPERHRSYRQDIKSMLLYWSVPTRSPQATYVSRSPYRLYWKYQNPDWHSQQQLQDDDTRDIFGRLLIFCRTENSHAKKRSSS